jgi:peptidoglycan/xylan/chitin deacetylase (PgdA/CDA1 family)
MPPPVRRGPAGERRIALTVDDGPCARTEEIAEILASHDARATFFMIGRWIPEHEPMLRRLVGRGHEIGNHAFDHSDLVGRPVASVVQILRTARRIRTAVGSAPRLFRPPHTRFDRWVRLAARLTRMTLVTWSVDPCDWSTATTAAQLRERVVDTVRGGDIVVLHENETVETATIAALPAILRELRARGYRMVTVSELLGARSMPAIRFETRREDAVTDAQRAELGALLADAFIEEDGAEMAAYVREHAHWSVPPLVRVLAFDGPRIVGQVSAYRMGPGVMGLGAGAVAPSHRGRRIMTRLLADGLEACGDDVVFGRTIPLSSVMCRELGFRPVQLPQLVPSPHWVARGDLSRVGELEIDDV